MDVGLWTPGSGLPPGARAAKWLRQERAREAYRYRHIRDPRVERTIQCAVTFRSITQFVATGTSPSVSEPTGAANTDMLVAFYLTTAAGAPTFPGTWTSAYNGSSTNTAWRVGYIQRGGSAPSLAFTHTGSIYYELHLMAIQGAATVTFDAQSTTGSVVTSSTAAPNPTAVIAVAASSLSIAGGFNFGVSGTNTWGAPAGYAIRTLNTGGIDAVMATKSLAAAGSEDPAIFTLTSVAADNMWNGFAITFTDAGGGGATVTYPDFEKTNRGINRGRSVGIA